MSAREIGLFPLASVLVPGELMPLHIFEERYKSLVSDCRQDDGEFALLYSDAEGARELGTTARVVEVLETSDDGPSAGDEATSALDLYRRIAEATGQEPDPDIGGESPGALSYAIAARVDFPAAE